MAADQTTNPTDPNDLENLQIPSPPTTSTTNPWSAPAIQGPNLNLGVSGIGNVVPLGTGMTPAQIAALSPAQTAAVTTAHNQNVLGGATDQLQYVDPSNQESAVQSWLNAGPNQSWDQSADYFTQRIDQTGGFTPDNIAYWQNMISQGQTPDQAAAATATPPPAVAPPSAAVAGGPSAADATSLFQQLMGIANQSQQVSPNDPIIAAQTAAYGAAQQKAARDTQTALSGSVGAYDPLGAQARSLQETAGTATSGFQASLMANELASRRTEIQNALSGATGLLTSEQQLQLQDELTKLQQAQQLLEFQQGQSQQASQFGQQLEQGAYQFDTTANNNNIQALTS